MSHEVKIPPIGESVSSGTLAQWHVASGDQVESGQTLLSLETDKITTEIEADEGGVIELLIQEGEEVEVGAVVAKIQASSSSSSQSTADAAPLSGSESNQSEPKEAESEHAREEPSEEQPSEEEPSEEEPSEEEPIEPTVAGDQVPAASSTSESAEEEREHAVLVPPVGESVSSGTLSGWMVEDGGSVEVGHPLFSLETDKITQEVEAEFAGVLTHQASVGDEVDIGQRVGMITAGAEPQASSNQAIDKTVEEGGTAHAKAAPSASPPERVSKALAESSAMLKRDSSASAKPADSKPQFNVVEGSGSKSATKPAASVSDQASKPDSGEGRVTRKKMSQLRRKIARHLVNAQQEAAILTTFNEVDMSAVMGLRKELQEGFVARHGIKLGFMSFFVKAVTEALKAVPSVNARIEDEEIIENHFYDIGCAMGTPKGLMVPVLRDCDSKSFAQIERDILDYAEKAKSGKMELSDLQGGVFTVSNGGVYGSLLSTPILNPPQSGILGMHTIQQRPVAIDGKVEIRPMMYLALSYDHRIVDGKEAVSFLIRVKDCIEQPTRLLVGA